MNADHTLYAQWDSAFVLGALSPSDRRRFEAHLAECEACRAAIVELTPTIALLARVTPDRAASLLDAQEGDAGPDSSRRRELIAVGVREARRRRRAWWAGGLAAAAALVVVIAVAIALSIGPALRSVHVVALEPTVDIPLTATVELTDVAWGTRLEMICRYPKAGYGDSPGWPYALVVIAADGTASEVSSWVAQPGATARIGAGTALYSDQIAAIEIRSLDSGRVLMRTELGD